MAIVDILLNKLKVQNPAGYDFIMQVRQSGRNPNDVLREMYQKGQINDAQLANIQSQGRMFGIRISNEDIQKIKAVDNKPQTPKKFGGWF